MTIITPARPLMLLAALLAGCAAPSGMPEEPRPGQPRQQQDVRYLCEGGIELEVSYLNPPTGESFASLYYEGRTVVMQSRPAASGVRYVDQDEQRGLRWHTKGNEGFLAVLPPDHTATEKILVNGCRAVDKR